MSDLCMIILGTIWARHVYENSRDNPSFQMILFPSEGFDLAPSGHLDFKFRKPKLSQSS